MKFVAYEIWTRSQVIEANDLDDAYDKADEGFEAVQGVAELNFSNWHVVPVDPLDEEDAPTP